MRLSDLRSKHQRLQEQKGRLEERVAGYQRQLDELEKELQAMGFGSVEDAQNFVAENRPKVEAVIVELSGQIQQLLLDIDTATDGVR